jgi:hypothetical protein
MLIAITERTLQMHKPKLPIFGQTPITGVSVVSPAVYPTTMTIVVIMIPLLALTVLTSGIVPSVTVAVSLAVTPMRSTLVGTLTFGISPTALTPY